MLLCCLMRQLKQHSHGVLCCLDVLWQWHTPHVHGVPHNACCEHVVELCLWEQPHYIISQQESQCFWHWWRRRWTGPVLILLALLCLLLGLLQSLLCSGCFIASRLGCWGVCCVDIHGRAGPAGSTAYCCTHYVASCQPVLP
jgi:hypothetical protein